MVAAFPLFLIGCIGDGGTNTPYPSSQEPPSLHSIGGTVSGLTGTGLILQNYGLFDLLIDTDGAFVFSTLQVDTSLYQVTVLNAPTEPAQTCLVTNGIGALSGADITNVDVTCKNILVSAALSGNNIDGHSWTPSISADGRYIAFTSEVSNLVEGDNNGTWDVFVRDTQTRITTRISVDSTGNEADEGSFIPLISDDGRFVTFRSRATNLVSEDSNGIADVFVHDRQTGITTLESVSSSGNQSNGDSAPYSISGDGRYIAFKSEATNLVEIDSNGFKDAFLRDTQTGITSRISRNSDGLGADNDSFSPIISSNGRYVAYASTAANLIEGDTNDEEDIFVYDTQTQTTIRASVDSNGNEADDDNYDPAISADGRYIVFGSYATNLVTADTNGEEDIFVFDSQTATTTRVSISIEGSQREGSSTAATISADGRYVTYVSNWQFSATKWTGDIFVYDRQNSITTQVTREANSARVNWPFISDDGRYITFETNGDVGVNGSESDLTKVVVIRNPLF